MTAVRGKYSLNQSAIASGFRARWARVQTRRNLNVVRLHDRRGLILNSASLEYYVFFDGKFRSTGSSRPRESDRGFHRSGQNGPSFSEGFHELRWVRTHATILGTFRHEGDNRLTLVCSYLEAVKARQENFDFCRADMICFYCTSSLE